MYRTLAHCKNYKDKLDTLRQRNTVMAKVAKVRLKATVVMEKY